MSENNKSYRIRTNVGSEYNGELKFNVNLLQDYDEFEILSLKIDTENLYKYHTSKYGCIVGRVLANGGIGVPNVKISSFIPVEDIDATDPVFSFLYPYTSTRDKNRDDIRYNLLTDTKIDDCHQTIGTFPNKRLVLDDNNVIEIYDKYYKFTTTTNGSGDYMLFGLPVGNNIIHSDLDLSDIGILSQKPRDLFYKGYTAKQFENASQFKKDTNLDNLTQVISQDSSIYVFPFWGDETENKGQIKIVRNDIDVNYKFEPTCIFIGSIVSDEKSNAISKNCIPHERMGKMDRLTTGAGTIEMIRKTVSGDIESISIQGNNLIDGNGTWCYQIPMNLDYVSTDEYGNLVPTDDYNKGLPTRTSVRFRVSLADYESDYENAHLVKVLVPNNPDITSKTIMTGSRPLTINTIEYDYEFGSATQDESFRDMFWNNVYTVKSYIPRFQKGNRQRNKNFSGFKAVNVNGANNPIPYNNMRINLTFLFVFQCLIFKSLVLIVKTLNKILGVINDLGCNTASCSKDFACGGDEGFVYLTLDGGMCPTLDGNYIAPGAKNDNKYNIIKHTYQNLFGDDYAVKPDVQFDGQEATYNATQSDVTGGPAIPYDQKSSDGKNSDLDPDPNNNGRINTGYTVEDVPYGTDSEEKESMKIYNQEDYFVKCVELQFAMEYEVIQFDFYNDWVNGMIYIPRWFAEIKKNKDNAYYCGNTFIGNRMLTQQCSVAYNDDGKIDSGFTVGCRESKQQCHKRWGRKQIKIFGRNRGIVTAQKNSRGQYAYYLRPNELITREDGYLAKANLFSTDVVLLGSVLDCNQYGIPKVNGYTSSSYKMPPPVAEIVSDTQEMEFSSRSNPVEYIKNKVINYANSIIAKIINKFLNEKYEIQPGDYNDKHKDEKDELLNIVRNYLNDNTIEDPVLMAISLGNVLNFHNKINKTDIKLPNELYVNKSDIDKTITGKTEVVNSIINIVSARCDNCIDKIIRWCEEWSISQGSIIGDVRRTCDNSDNYIMFRDLRDSLITGVTEYLLSEYVKTKLNIEYDKASREINGDDPNVKFEYFYSFDKKTVDEVQLDDENETTYSELSGIDWGYNPFKTDDDDDTTLMKNQNAGHFLEIGCTFSLSNIKSCVNLQRVCEIGGEISQSHYYYDTDTNIWNLLDPSGIIAKREITDAGIRGSFSTLNSRKLGIIYDTTNGYKKYTFIPYNPVSFMGDLANRDEISDLTNATEKYPGYPSYDNYGLIENQSLSYRAFRFGTTGNTVGDKFLIHSGDTYYMPQYENSFYFYFGLRDGNTAIDRLYNEYYAPCNTNNGLPGVSFIVEEDQSIPFLEDETLQSRYRYKVHYSTENMGYIKWVTLKSNGIILSSDVWSLDKKKGIISIKYDDMTKPKKILITLKDNRGQVVKDFVVLKHVKTKIITYTTREKLHSQNITIVWQSNGVPITTITGSMIAGTTNYADDHLSGTFEIEKKAGTYTFEFLDENNNVVDEITIKGWNGKVPIDEPTVITTGPDVPPEGPHMA